MPSVRARDRFVTTREVATVLVASTAAANGAEAFYCRPESYRELEAVLVPETDRRAGDYAGYSLVFPVSEIDGALRRL
jgi:hypothetical protein